MNRSVRLAVGLALALAFISFLTFDKPQSQSRQKGKPGNEYNYLLAVANRPVDCGELMAEYDKAIQKHPGEPRFYAARAQCRANQVGNTSVEEYKRVLPKIKAEVSADLDRAIALDPKFARAYYVRALMFARWLRDSGDDPAPISKDFDEAIKLEPRNEEFYFGRAASRFWNLNDRPGALSDLDRLLLLSPRNPKYLSERARFRAEIGDHSGAVADYSTVLRFKPRDPYARPPRARIYLMMGEYQKALSDLNLFLKYYPDEAVVVLQDRAQVYRALGDFRKAEADEKRFKQLTDEMERELDELIDGKEKIIMDSNKKEKPRN